MQFPPPRIVYKSIEAAGIVAEGGVFLGNAKWDDATSHRGGVQEVAATSLHSPDEAT